MRNTSMAFICAILGTIIASQASAETVQTLVDRAIEYHGGPLYTASRISMTITSKSGSFRLVSEMDGGLFDHRVTRVRDGQEQIVRLTNDGVDLIADGQTRSLDGPEAQKLTTFVNERIYFPFLPYRLNDPGVIKTDLGEETWGNRTLRKVKVTFQGAAADGDEYVYWFDPRTARLEQFAYSFTNNGGGLRFRRAFDYRRVGGLLFFDAENLGLSGTEHRVDEITPEFVSTNMSNVSTVKLSEIAVRPL